MSNAKYLVIAALFAFVLAGCVGNDAGASATPAASVAPSNEPPEDAPPAPPEDVPASELDSGETNTTAYTMTDVEAHAVPEDCWLAIHEKVYNVSGFGAKHGGGEAIYQGCGKNATELFETRPMGSGTPHSEKARSFLPNFYIGELAQ
ncbi:hypothetical protein AUJ14_01500 [Candidatus Micrarchaeota archaeon CG1_02_55_22]|nr:MAG: hypothetical protein AUJ14_01500 [Candidatus Micrarchaeota archaeon CG1_02_55_22]